jgi:3-phenylpropionate/trans-cinnamate dioxygenase ferredoxin reductase subunit
MLGFLFGKKSNAAPATARINGQAITLQPKETLLQAALREGIEFPHSCRVGGCATCKCKLVSGQVKELTETGYILSEAELDQGYILACQAVPKGDVSIEVDLSAQKARQQVSGRVLRQDKLTHDITALTVRLDAPLLWRAGQYAQLSVASLPGVARSYSFADPVQAEGTARFFVREVPGGEFSTHINRAALMGQAVQLDGPIGEFWLRPDAQAPLLMIAGGSGLAPILAMLKDALAQGVQRPVTLLFGARTQRDLYALDEIEALARQCTAGLRFVPMLSEEPAGSDWRGARGLVTQALCDTSQALVVPGCHAYLCGPPPMIDAALPLLTQQGVARSHIHADRFTTLHDQAVAA